MKNTLPLLLAGVSLFLFACGGDTNETTGTRLLSSSMTSSDDGLTTQVLARKRPPKPRPGETLDPRLTCNLLNFKQEIMDRINQARASGRNCGTTYYGPAPALAWNTNLFNAAGAHSTDMAANNYFSNTSLDGRNAGQRITDAGYAWSAYGENIAAGQTSVQSVVDAWLASPSYCANIMNPGYVDVGTACAVSSTSSYPTYWTMDLARPQ